MGRKGAKKKKIADPIVPWADTMPCVFLALFLLCSFESSSHSLLRVVKHSEQQRQMMLSLSQPETL